MPESRRTLNGQHRQRLPGDLRLASGKRGRFASLSAVALIVLPLLQLPLLAQEQPAAAPVTASVRAAAVPLEFAPNPLQFPATLQPVTSVAFSRDGKFLATGQGAWRAEQGAIQVWNVESGQRVAREQLPVGASQVGWSRDGSQLVASVWNSTVRVYGFPSMRQTALFPIDQSASRFGISPDGTRVMTAAEGYVPLNESLGRVIQIWDAKTSKLIRKFANEPDMFRMGCATWSPGGKYVAAGGGNYSAPTRGIAGVWDPETGKQIARFEGHTRFIRAIQFFADEQRVATAALDGTLQIWEAATGKLISTITAEGGLNDLAISPDGSLVATATISGTVSLWYVQTSAHSATVETGGRPNQCVAFSPDGQRLALGGSDGIVKIWSVSTNELQKELPAAGGDDRPGRPVIIAPSMGGQTVVVAYDTGELRAVSPATSAVLWKVTHSPGQEPSAVAVSTDRANVIVGTKAGKVRIHSAKNGEVLQNLKPMPGRVTAVLFSANGNRFTTGDAEGRLWIWDSAKLVPLQECHDHLNRVLAVGFSSKHATITSVGADGSAITRQIDRDVIVKQRDVSTSPLISASISRDGSTLFALGATENYWDAVSLEPVSGPPTPRSGTGTSVLSSDGSNLVTIDSSLTGLVVNLPQARPKYWENPSGNARSPIAWSPDDRYLYQANGSGGLTINVVVPAKRSAIGRIPREGNAVTVAASPDGKWLAAGGDDSQVTLWDLATGEIVDMLPAGGGPVYVCRFSADSRLLATGTLSGRLKVWNVAERTLEGSLLNSHPAIRSLAFSPDGRWLASGGTDRVLKVTDTTTWETVATEPNQPLWVQGLAFAPDGRTLYSVTGSWSPTDLPFAAQLSAWTVKADKSSLSLQLKKTIPVSNGNVDDVLATPDSRLVITGSGDGQIKLWNADTLAAVRSIRTPTSIHRMHVLPGNPTLLAIGDHLGGVSVWDITAGTLVSHYAGHTGHVFDVTSVPNGGCLITAGEDDSLLFWPGPAAEPDSGFYRFLKRAAPLTP